MTFFIKKSLQPKMGKSTVPICPSVCANALSECVNTWFLKWNSSEECLWLQLKKDGEARKSQFFLFFSTSKYGKAPGSNLSVCLWERFEWVCQHLIFEMKQQRIFMGTNKDRQRSKKMKFFQPLKMEKPPVLICLWECFEWVSLPDFLNETAMNNIYDYK